ncbi:MAG TPA: glycosyltransferase [Burkholderiaceae bacterium]|jgi:mannosylfructose-phosphate synthase
MANRPRIAMVSTHGYVAAHPPLGAADTGGQVVYVLELSKKLGRLGFDVDIWTRQFEDQPELDVVDDRVRVVRVPCGGPDFIPKEHLHRELATWRANALAVIRRDDLRYQFIDSHYWDGGIAGQALAQALGIPHVHTPHSLGLWKRRDMETADPQRTQALEAEFNFAERIRCETALYQACELLVATTPPQVEMITADYGIEAAKVHMIPPGYDDNRFYPVSAASRQYIRQRLGFSGPTVLALGRLATNKGYDLLIDAFTHVARRLPDAKLHLAIGGENINAQEQALLDELQQRARELGLGEAVHFGGFIADEDLADHYRAADVFVLSSRYEPFGMTAIEAMACGTPTVVTLHGGLNPAITFGRHGLYADPLDRDDLGIMMYKPLRHHRLWGRLSRMGAHKARSLFTWTGIAQQLLGIVEGRPALEGLVDFEWDEPWNDGD